MKHLWYSRRVPSLQEGKLRKKPGWCKARQLRHRKRQKSPWEKEALASTRTRTEEEERTILGTKHLCKMRANIHVKRYWLNNRRLCRKFKDQNFLYYLYIVSDAAVPSFQVNGSECKVPYTQRQYGKVLSLLKSWTILIYAFRTMTTAMSFNSS